MNLNEKNELLEKVLEDRHLINEGLYGSDIFVDQDGNILDPEEKTIGHAICWTAGYLNSLAYKWLVTKDENVRIKAQKVLDSFKICLNITGTKGVVCRGYKIGHGLSIEEKYGIAKSKIYIQGQGEYSKYRYVSSPSHHNHDHVVRGLCSYYMLAATEKQKVFIKEELSVMAQRVYLDNKMQAFLPDGDLSAAIIFSTSNIPNDTVVMAMAGMKLLSHVLDDNRYEQLYNDLADKIGIKKYQTVDTMDIKWVSQEHGHDDAEHIFVNLYLLTLIEKNTQMLNFINAYTELLWKRYKNDGVTPFNFLYAAITNNIKNANLDHALDTLERYPISRFFEPKMNSKQNKFYLETVRTSDKLYPIDVRPIDNEFEWKGNPYLCDGWLARGIVSLQVAPEDPMIIMMVDDTGLLYISIDGGTHFEEINQAPDGIKSIFIHPESMRLVLAGTKNGLYRSLTGGYSWEKIKLADQNNFAVKDIYMNPENNEVMYVVTENGVYRSISFDASYVMLASSWERIDLPELGFNVDEKSKSDEKMPGNPLDTTVSFIDDKALISSYRDGRIYYKFEDERKWNFKKAYFGAFWHQPIWSPTWVNSNELYGFASYGGPQRFAIKFNIKDDFWKGLGMKNYLPDNWSIGEGLSDTVAVCMKVDEPNIYIGTNKGLGVSYDNGDTWRLITDSFEIPFVTNIFLTKIGIFVSTPSGLYKSTDNLQTFERIIVLNGKGVLRTQSGTGDFVYAYWLGKYLEFVK